MKKGRKEEGGRRERTRGEIKPKDQIVVGHCSFGWRAAAQAGRAGRGSVAAVSRGHLIAAVSRGHLVGGVVAK